jgi:small GTP-binding protein
MRELSKKICLLGDAAVGKTSLVRRFVYDLFDDKYVSTIGVKVSRKMVTVSQANEIMSITMMLWDLAGSEEFDQVRTSYMRGAAGAILVCDLTRPETLDSLKDYVDRLLNNDPETKLVFAANKSDLVDQQVIKLEQIAQVAKTFSSSYYVTSAKTGSQVETLFRYMGQLLVTSV